MSTSEMFNISYYYILYENKLVVIRRKSSNFNFLYVNINTNDGFEY